MDNRLKAIEVAIIAFGLAVIMILVYEMTARADERIINGNPVKPGEYTEVVKIKTGNAGCSASLIGPKVLLTAAHCATNGATSEFKVGSESYTAKMARHPQYPVKDVDICLGIVDREVTGIKPVSIYDGDVKEGMTIKLFGYGCTQSGGGGGSDGVLREGDTKITGFTGFDIVSKMDGGAALCYGDSGGPVMIMETGKYRQAAVNSKGNIKDTNYTTNLVGAEPRQFLVQFAADNKVDICGISKDCSGGPAPDKFTLENVAVKVDVESKGQFDTDYLKTYFGYLMSFLSSPKGAIIPIPSNQEIPRGFCSCGNGHMAVCSSKGYGYCDRELSCFCE